MSADSTNAGFSGENLSWRDLRLDRVENRWDGLGIELGIERRHGLRSLLAIPAQRLDEADLTARKGALEAQIEGESSALYATGRVWDDGIIHPNDSRTVLGLALSAAHSNVVEGSDTYGVWRH